MADPTAGGMTSISIEEMENQQARDASQPTDLTKITVDGADVPDNLKGKTAADVVAHAKALAESLKLSEAGRQQAIATAQLATAQRPPELPVAPPEPKEPTPEELRQLYDEDPFKAMQLMSDIATRKAERNLAGRMGSLAASTASTVEANARAKFAEDFALFGEDITRMASQLPDKSVLTNPQAWEDMISFVRGKRENVEKIIAHRTGQTTEDRRRQAQQEQVVNVGFSGTEAQLRKMPESVGQMDSLQREIADKLGMSPEDYIKWSKV